MRIWIYQNQTELVRGLKPLLIKEGYQLTVCRSLQELERGLKTEEPQLLIMDVNMGEEGSAEGCRLIARVRAGSSVPILVVSEDRRECSKILSLDAGADDYVTADCGILETQARVKSLIRRYTSMFQAMVNARENIERIYTVEELTVDDLRKRVFVGEREVNLTPMEYKILRLLVQERGRILGSDEIYRTIWHMKAIGADNTIAVHIRHIREKIEENPAQPRYIKVVWGVGYKVG